MASDRVGKTNFTRLLDYFRCEVLSQYIRLYNRGTDREKWHILNILQIQLIFVPDWLGTRQNFTSTFLSDVNYQVDVRPSVLFHTKIMRLFVFIRTEMNNRTNKAALCLWGQLKWIARFEWQWFRVRLDSLCMNSAGLEKILKSSSDVGLLDTVDPDTSRSQFQGAAFRELVQTGFSHIIRPHWGILNRIMIHILTVNWS